MKDFDGYVEGMRHRLITLPKEEDIKKHFVNTPLEKFSDSIYAFWVSEPVMRSADNCFDVFREGVRDYIDECLALAECVRASKNTTFSGKGWKLSAASDLRAVSCTLETLLVDKLYGFEVLFHGNLPEDEDKYSTARGWAISLKAFPRVEALNIDLDSYRENRESFGVNNSLLSIDLLDRIIDSLKTCRKVAKGFTIEHDMSTINRFVAFMLDNGLPQTRKMYRELYRALDIFGCIPDYVKKSHDTTTSSDPQSNYIKSVVTTINRYREIDEKV